MRTEISETDMNRAAWAAPCDPGTAAKRAGGRRAYNLRRQHEAFYRRREIWKILFQEGKFYEVGIRIRLAARLNISYSQVCRDIAKLKEEMAPCPHCHAPARLIRHKV